MVYCTINHSILLLQRKCSSSKTLYVFKYGLTVLRTSGAWRPSHMGCWKTQWSSRFHRSTAAGWRSDWTEASWNISTASPRSLACPVHTDTQCRYTLHILEFKTKQNITSQITTDLLDLVLLHKGQELEKEPGQAEQEVNELMDEERPPGGDLKLGVIVQHVAPGMLQRVLEGVLWQRGVDVLHSQIGRGQDVGRTVHLHDGRRGKEGLRVWREDWERRERRCHTTAFRWRRWRPEDNLYFLCFQASKFKSACSQLCVLKTQLSLYSFNVLLSLMLFSCAAPVHSWIILLLVFDSLLSFLCYFLWLNLCIILNK